jgi:hypothetical protein
LRALYADMTFGRFMRIAGVRGMQEKAETLLRAFRQQYNNRMIENRLI